VEHLRFGDYKTRLQQLVQQDGKEELTYRVVREDGPEHNKHFEVEALINSNVVGRGSGKSKRDAEQTAAKEALVLFGVSNKEERSRRCT
jgi:ribonuclease-3